VGSSPAGAVMNATVEWKPEFYGDPRARMVAMLLILRRVPRNKTVMSRQKLTDLIEEDLDLIKVSHPKFSFTLAAGTVLFRLIDQMIELGVLFQTFLGKDVKPEMRNLVTLSFHDFQVIPTTTTKTFEASVPPEVRAFVESMPMSPKGLLDRLAEQA
jgi:hypothetical protein